MSDFVDVSTTDSAVEITLNRREKKNAITAQMYADMVAAIQAAEADTRPRSVILSGAGAAFSAGNDLQDFLVNPPLPDSPVVQFLRTIANIKTPLVAAVQGPAIGVAATLLLHCDFVVATEDAVLQFPFVSRALVPEAGSSLLLPRAVGYLRAAEIMLTGDPVSAERAEQLGLVSRVVPAGQHVDEARAFADRMAAQPRDALRLTKALLKEESSGLEVRMLTEGELFNERVRTPEFAEVVQAFLQRRAPDFSAIQSG